MFNLNEVPIKQLLRNIKCYICKVNQRKPQLNTIFWFNSKKTSFNCYCMAINVPMLCQTNVIVSKLGLLSENVLFNVTQRKLLIKHHIFVWLLDKLFQPLLFNVLMLCLTNGLDSTFSWFKEYVKFNIIFVI